MGYGNIPEVEDLRKSQKIYHFMSGIYQTNFSLLYLEQSSQKKKKMNANDLKIVL